ncbi:b2 protein [Fagus crenata]
MMSGKRADIINEKKKEKLGGLIFMCNAKTKPDCFCHAVMGVSTSKKDLVMGIKPGLKLFLFDFDLKLLYGIYKASSSGGMKLEPRAFSGAFLLRSDFLVRFIVKKDCFPLPEGVFKKAIKENYNENHKFKTELTVRQHLLRQPDHIYRDTIPVQRETLYSDHLYFNEKDYQTYGLGARRELPTEAPVATVTSATAALGSYTSDPYYAYRYGASSRDPYLPPVRREEVPSSSYSVGGTYPVETAHLRGIETDQLERYREPEATTWRPIITTTTTWVC